MIEAAPPRAFNMYRLARLYVVLKVNSQAFSINSPPLQAIAAG